LAKVQKPNPFMILSWSAFEALTYLIDFIGWRIIPVMLLGDYNRASIFFHISEQQQ